MSKIVVKDFHLEYTLSCGQLFRVFKSADWYYITLRNRVFKVRQLSDQLEFCGIDKKSLIRYFALDEPYPDILVQINKDKHIDKAIRKYHGLRILRQDPWECLISFICSSAANIPKIRLNVELLSQFFGKEIGLNNFKCHTFPHPGELNDYEQILKAKTGFRAKYIKAANDQITEKFLSSLKKRPYSNAKQALKQIPGVGDKVADCILLFSLGFTEAFPVDTWIKKIVQKIYFRSRRVSNKKVHEFASNYFGRYAGYAQQYLYMYAKDLTYGK